MELFYGGSCRYDQLLPGRNHYPRFQPLQQINYYGTTSSVTGAVYPLSSSMYEFDMPLDTITAIVANVDEYNAIARSTAQQTVDVTLSSQSLASPYDKLANGMNAKISVDTVSLWRWSYMQVLKRNDHAITGESCSQSFPPRNCTKIISSH